MFSLIFLLEPLWLSWLLNHSFGWQVVCLNSFIHSTRLQTVTGAWQKLLSVMSVGEIVHSLKQGLLTLLQHLRAMDVDRHFCDRTSGELASENYDIWVWMTKVTP